MDSELKELLKENLKVNKENNELLKKIRKFQKWGQTSKAIYWFVVLLFAFGAWYFVQPYLKSLLGYFDTVSDLSSGIGNINNFSDVKTIQNLLDQIQ